MRKPVLLILFLLAAPALAQHKKPAGPTVKELQATIIDLQSQLLACQKDKITAQAVAANPEAEATDALRTFLSTIGTGVNWSAYRDALIPLKVKADRLPDGEATAPLKRVLRKFVDAGHLWNLSIAGGRVLRGGLVVVPTAAVAPYTTLYADQWQRVVERYPLIGRSIGTGDDTAAYGVEYLAMRLMAEARHDAEAIVSSGVAR